MCRSNLPTGPDSISARPPPVPISCCLQNQATKALRLGFKGHYSRNFLDMFIPCEKHRWNSWLISEQSSAAVDSTVKTRRPIVSIGRRWHANLWITLRIALETVTWLLISQFWVPWHIIFHLQVVVPKNLIPKSVPPNNRNRSSGLLQHRLVVQSWTSPAHERTISAGLRVPICSRSGRAGGVMRWQGYVLLRF